MDEISNLGSARIRLRSLKAAIDEREKGLTIRKSQVGIKTNRKQFLQKKQKRHIRLLLHKCFPTHFELFETAFNLHGYQFKVMKNVSRSRCRRRAYDT